MKVINIFLLLILLLLASCEKDGLFNRDWTFNITVLDQNGNAINGAVVAVTAQDYQGLNSTNHFHKIIEFPSDTNSTSIEVPFHKDVNTFIITPLINGSKDFRIISGCELEPAGDQIICINIKRGKTYDIVMEVEL